MNYRVSNFLLYLSLLIVMTSTSFARYGNLSMNDLEQDSGGTFSMISREGQNVLNMNIAKSFSFDDLSARVGVNIVFPENKRPQGLSLLEIRYVQYDNGLWGIRFGELSAETYGYGLIMDDYDASPESTYFNMSRAGAKGYTKIFSPLGVYAMHSGTGVAGARFTYELVKLLELNTPLVVGLSYIVDSDGIVDSTGTLINKNAQGYSADLGFKLIDPWMDAYLEYGLLSNQSSALALGTKIDGGEIIDYRLEYRILGENFIPGFFNANYEIAPANIKDSYPAGYGYFAGAEVRLAPLGVVSFGYEKYSNRDSVLRAAVAFNKINGMSGVVSYEQTLQSATSHKINGVLVYPLNAVTSLVTYFEQIGNKETSYTLAYKMNF